MLQIIGGALRVKIIINACTQTCVDIEVRIVAFSCQYFVHVSSEGSGNTLYEHRFD